MPDGNALAIPTGTGLLELLASESPFPTPYAREITLLECRVAGTVYRSLEPSTVRIEAGQALSLRREPENPYDPLAIRVESAEGVHLGYLPRRDNPVVARLMDAGKLIVARVLTAEWREDGPRVTMEVLLCDE